MKNSLWLGILVVSTIAIGNASPARAAEGEIRRFTNLIVHDAYTETYENAYTELQYQYSRSAFDYCAIQLNVHVITRPGLFRKGQHYGELVARCYNPAVKDIALSFYTYPYDEQVQSKLEILFKNGDRKEINTCWRIADGRFKDCDTLPGFRTLQPNFTNARPPAY